MQGYPRSDGRKGIRNVVVIAYLVECARHVAHEIALGFRERDVHVIGFSGCFRSAYGFQMMERLCCHPNVGAVLLVSLGCEGFDRGQLEARIEASSRPVETLVIQNRGGTSATIAAGQKWLEGTLATLEEQKPVPMSSHELVVGTICGGSDTTSGLTANPAVGKAFDLLVEEGAAVLFEETGELIGCEHFMAERAVRPELGQEILACMAKAVEYYRTMGQGSIEEGNLEGGLSTIEEKSLGAYAKSGQSAIKGLLKPGDQPPEGGLYLLDIVPDGEPRFGFPSINDNQEIAELMASGCQVILFTTGRGSVVGSAVAPVIKVCANPQTYRNLADDMDVNAGRILEGEASLSEVGEEIRDLVRAVAGGARSRSEALGHREFVLGYKSFEPIGPACLPGSG
ncbi:MAG TPA: UxaA family hydrolase [Alphaproteobacteria bacterium]|jgi:altronate hydrolase|nr:UxaA family hydrolase [Alphaproteobacteria bacterium]MDP6270977.1 UxaA family hydrolase [Alphaproteobacteria bacterium]HJM50821.1 UxaA family hydrolase [Alphaproteobacteria bacterium]